jgi:hypothetical protein
MDFTGLSMGGLDMPNNRCNIRRGLVGALLI